MAKEFKLQDPGEGIHEAKIVELNVSEGDEVSDGDVLMTVETDKAAVEVPAPFDGTIVEIRVSEGEDARVGDVLLTYEEGRGEQREQREQKGGEERERRDEDGDDEGGREEDGEGEAREAEGEEKEKRSNGEGDSGREEEDEVGEKEGELDRDENGEEEVEEEEDAGAERSDRKKARPVPASPATRRLARELEVDLDAVEGSGPEGRVTKEDVEAAAEETSEAEPEEEKEAPEEEKEEKEEKEPTKPALPDFSQWGEVEREPLSGVRQAIAKKMALSWSEIPHVTHQDFADVTELEALRQEHAGAVEEEGGKLTLTVLVMKAVVAALREFPRFNASLDPGAGELVLKRYVHIGVAVDTDQGLLVPVIRDVDRKPIAELAAELAEVSDRARAGELEHGEMRGGSFTVTNPGPLGGTAFTPIINHPEVAILGMARAERVPAFADDGETVVPRLHLPLCLAFDHRVNDGADAARFLTRVIETLEEPSAFFLKL